MPYVERSRVLELETHGWVDLQTFRSKIRSIWYRSSLNEPNKASDSCNIILDLVDMPPFDLHQRFPDSIMYVDIDHPYVATRLHNIIENLSWMDRNGGTTPVNPEFALKVTTLKSAVSQLICPDTTVDDQTEFGNYTRDSFEQVFELTWVLKSPVVSDTMDFSVII